MMDSREGRRLPGTEVDADVDGGANRTCIAITVNGVPRAVGIDTRQTLLDFLREDLALTGTKSGCNQGTCGACTVELDGSTALACLTLAVDVSGSRVTTIEGLAGENGTLHVMQQAFVDSDGLQCGFCTPGQVMSAVACVREGRASCVEEIREFMSGNLCRCGAYPGIVSAIRAVAEDASR